MMAAAAPAPTLAATAPALKEAKPKRAAPFYQLPGASDIRAMLAQLPPGTIQAQIPMAYRLEPDRKVATAQYAFAYFSGDVDGDGEAEYVMGCYFSDAATGGAADDRARLAVFKAQGTSKGKRTWHLTWTSPGLGHEFDLPRYNAREVEEGLEQVEAVQPPIQLVRLEPGGPLAIAYFAWSRSAQVGGLPGIYRFTGGRWRNVGPQADRLNIADLDGDGRPEVIAGTRFVGYGFGDDDVPRVFRWDGQQFAEASSDFPQYYARLLVLYRNHLHRLEETQQVFARDVWERAIRKAETLAHPVSTRRPPRASG
jgi:hypothetical protein